jgi:hypothetical protein
MTKKIKFLEINQKFLLAKINAKLNGTIIFVIKGLFKAINEEKKGDKSQSAIREMLTSNQHFPNSALQIVSEKFLKPLPTVK